MDTIGDIAVRKIGQFDPVPIEEAHCDECDLPVLTNSTPCAAGAYEGQPCRPSMEPTGTRLDQFKIFIQGELSPDEIRWMAELAADFLCSDKVKAWRTAGLATEYRAALAEAHPIGGPRHRVPRRPRRSPSDRQHRQADGAGRATDL